MNHPVLAIALKDLLQITRDKAGMFWRFGFPLLMAVFFGVVMSGAGGGGGSMSLDVIAIDHDKSPQSVQFIEKLAANEALFLHRHTGGEAEKPYTEELAREQVRKGEKTAFLIIPEGFGEAISVPFINDPPEISIGIDPGRESMVAMIEGLIVQEAFVSMQNSLMDTENLEGMIEMARDEILEIEPTTENQALDRYLISLQAFLNQVPVEQWFHETRTEEKMGTEENQPNQASINDQPLWKPVAISQSEVFFESEGPSSGFEISFPQAIIWSLLGGAATFGLSFMIEIRNGTLMRLQSAPISRTFILVGKSTAAVLSLYVSSMILMLIGVLIFGIRPNSWILLLVSLFAGSWMITGLVMFLAQFGKTEESTGGIIWAVLIVSAMFGGGMMPLFIMPGWLQSISTFSPIRWVTIAVEGALWRNFAVSEMVTPIVVLFLIGTVSLFLGVWRMRWK